MIKRSNNFCYFKVFFIWSLSVYKRICITDCYNGTGDDTVDDGRDDTVDDGRDDTVDGKPCFQYEEYKSTDSAFEINQVLKKWIFIFKNQF